VGAVAELFVTHLLLPTTLVPSRFEEDLKLGKWVETQRYEYTKLQRVTGVEANGEPDGESSAQRASNPRLTEERLKRLEAIGFQWRVKHKMKRYYDKQWDHMFDRLLKFKDENGHCMVPKRYLAEPKLGAWVHTQRVQHRRMAAGVKYISDVGSDVNTDDNGARLEEYLPYKHDISTGLDEDVYYKLTEARCKRLEEIGFVWSAREIERENDQNPATRNCYDDQWDLMFDQLKAHKERVGNCLIPKRFSENQKL
jgi:hypothetical protein